MPASRSQDHFQSLSRKLTSVWNDLIVCRYVVTLVAMYNVGDLLGRYIPLIDGLLLKSRRMLIVAVLSRVAFIPAFYFTAKYGPQGWMIILTILLGISNGYVTVCAFIGAPKGYLVRNSNLHYSLLYICHPKDDHGYSYLHQNASYQLYRFEDPIF